MKNPNEIPPSELDRELINDDPQLRELLHTWKTPTASPQLEARVMRARQHAWSTLWSALWTSYIRIPVPVACCAVLLLIAGVWRFIEVSQTTAPCQSPSLAAAPQSCQSDRPC